MAEDIFFVHAIAAMAAINHTATTLLPLKLLPLPIAVLLCDNSTCTVHGFASQPAPDWPLTSRSRMLYGGAPHLLKCVPGASQGALLLCSVRALQLILCLPAFGQS